MHGRRGIRQLWKVLDTADLVVAAIRRPDSVACGALVPNLHVVEDAAFNRALHGRRQQNRD